MNGYKIVTSRRLTLVDIVFPHDASKQFVRVSWTSIYNFWKLEATN